MVESEAVYETGGFTKIDRDTVLTEIADSLSKPCTAQEVPVAESGLRCSLI
jgi:hypothetical protein